VPISNFLSTGFSYSRAPMSRGASNFEMDCRVFKSDNKIDLFQPLPQGCRSLIVKSVIYRPGKNLKNLRLSAMAILNMTLFLALDRDPGLKTNIILSLEPLAFKYRIYDTLIYHCFWRTEE
jgi:hypothetical protein